MESNVVKKQEHWDEVITSKTGLFDLKLREVWKYRDLVSLLVRRDFVTSFKQTILGPLWFFISPMLTSAIYIIIFTVIARIPTDGIPPILFYLSGITLWNYFSSALTLTSNVFTANANVFGKVYFPRLVMPLSIIISRLMQFGVQMLLFFVFWLYYWMQGVIEPNIWLLAVPYYVLLCSIIAMGLGLIFSSLTTKYKDVSMLLGFCIQLWMYATPVIYPSSIMPASVKVYLQYNPMIGIFEGFKYAFLGKGSFDPTILFYPTAFAIIILALGVLIFNKVEKSFMDTV
ncbi:ABC transporter permease [Sphingobacterium wenxiniae]|uniref:ABC transporter permease n=1 Tax=Sphingobacterium wenxiniae TaxID=683125 RepID=UPI001FCD9B71|nr:ABC transporter permease [Sphingobacterium wenxiniae]